MYIYIFSLPSVICQSVSAGKSAEERTPSPGLQHTTRDFARANSIYLWSLVLGIRWWGSLPYSHDTCCSCSKPASEQEQNTRSSHIDNRHGTTDCPIHSSLRLQAALASDTSVAPSQPGENERQALGHSLKESTVDTLADIYFFPVPEAWMAMAMFFWPVSGIMSHWEGQIVPTFSWWHHIGVWWMFHSQLLLIFRVDLARDPLDPLYWHWIPIEIPSLGPSAEVIWSDRWDDIGRLPASLPQIAAYHFYISSAASIFNYPGLRWTYCDRNQKRIISQRFAAVPCYRDCCFFTRWLVSFAGVIALSWHLAYLLDL